MKLQTIIEEWLDKQYHNKKFIKTVNYQTLDELKLRIPELTERIVGVIKESAIKVCDGDDDCIDNFNEIFESILTTLTKE